VETVTFTVTVDEANVILGVLGTQPFQSVAALIVNLQGQAAEQLNPKPVKK